MTYVLPELGPHTAVYKSRRFWCIQLSEHADFEGFAKSDDWQYIVWDKAYGAVVATICRESDGRLRGALLSQHPIWEFFNDIKTATHRLGWMMEYYLEAIGK